MLKITAPFLTVILAAGVAAAQNPTRVYTHPLVPTDEALNRLGMKLAWKTYVPVETSQDGISTVQVLGDRMFMQLRNGAVVAINADTGQTIWRARVGAPYKLQMPLGFNFDTVFGFNGTRLFALDRATGRTKWESELTNMPVTGPVADSGRVYINLIGNKITVFNLPLVDLGAPPPPQPNTLLPPPPPGQRAKPEILPSPPDPGQRRSALGVYYPSESFMTTPLTDPTHPPRITSTPLVTAQQSRMSLAGNYQLQQAWEYVADSALNVSPLLSMRKPDSPGVMMIPSSSGVTYGTLKVEKVLMYSFQTESPVSAQPVQYGDIAYIPFRNATMIAMNIENGKLLWRLGTGGLSRTKPQVNDEDVYMMPEREGLYRLNRATGQVIWKNAKAERFIAASPQIVYALDPAGQLLLIDRARGTELTRYDIREFKVPVVNDYTDRVFLAAHDGLVICLHDRHYATPAWSKQLVEEGKPEKRKPMELPGQKVDK